MTLNEAGQSAVFYAPTEMLFCGEHNTGRSRWRADLLWNTAETPTNLKMQVLDQ